MTGDDKELAVGTEPDALHWEGRSVQIKQLDTLDLEVAAIILIDVEHLEQTIVWTDDQVLAIGREITAFWHWGELDGVYQISFIIGGISWI